MPKTPHIAVIGAGPGGLASAVLLAASGARVTVYERQPEIGGRTGRIALPAPGGGAFCFDRGATFFLMPYVLGEIFAAAGARLADRVDLRRLDPMYRLIIGREGRDPLVLETTQDPAEMARRLDAAAPGQGAGVGFARFMADNRTKLRLSERILRRPIRSPADLLDPESAKVLSILHPRLSVHRLLERYFTDEHVRLAVSFQTKYLGMSPFDCPSLFTILPFIEHEYGIWHPIGGCHALMRALADLLGELGGRVLLGRWVERIAFDGRRAAGVQVDGRVTPHDAVVVNADATWALKNLVPEELRERGPAKRYAGERLDRMRYSCSTYMLYLGIDGSVDHLPHHTIYTSRSYRQNLIDITRTGRLSGDDPSVYVCNPSRLDPTMAPPGKSSLYVLVPTPNLKDGCVDWERDAGELREVALAQLERVFGIADVRSRIEAEARAAPPDWAQMGINFGATFNLGHQLTQMLWRRPQNRPPGFERLYLVGGGTHPGSGLPTIFLSAQISARLACEDAGLAYAGG